jgi:PP-loop superfamily ATP-utilizing enzyme
MLEQYMDEISMHIISQTKGKARVAVLFSGGIDSSVLTFIAHRCEGTVKMNKHFDLFQFK